MTQAFKDELFCWHYSNRRNTNATACETTLLYQLVEQYYPSFQEALAEQGQRLPKYVEREFDDFLRCGRLEYGFMRVVCGDCKHEKLVAFSCKRRGLPRSARPSCGARRMAESAALLVDDVLDQ